MVAQALYHSIHAKRLVRNNPHGQRLHLTHWLYAFNIWNIAVHTGSQPSVDRPHARVAQASSTEGRRIIGIAEAEITVFSLEISSLAGKTDAVVRNLHVGGIGNIHSAYTALVGVRHHGIIGHSHRNPHHFLAARTTAYHFKNPRLIRVAHRERFARTAEAIFVNKTRHHFDGLTGCARPLQSQEHKRSIVNYSCGIDQFFTSVKGALPNRHLPFIDVSVHKISDWRLRNLPVINPCVSVINLTHGARTVSARLKARHLVHGAPRVNIIGAHHRTVDACLFPNKYARTCLTLWHTHCHQCCK